MDPYAQGQSFFHPITIPENFRVPRPESDIVRPSPVLFGIEDHEMKNVPDYQMDIGLNGEELDVSFLEKQDEEMGTFTFEPSGHVKFGFSLQQADFHTQGPGTGPGSYVIPQAHYAAANLPVASFAQSGFEQQAATSHGIFMQATQQQQVQVEPDNWHEGRFRRRGAVAAVDVSLLFQRAVSEAKFYRNVVGMGSGRVFCISKPKQDFSERKRPRPYPHISVLLEWRRSIYSKA